MCIVACIYQSAYTHSFQVEHHRKGCVVGCPPYYIEDWHLLFVFSLNFFEYILAQLKAMTAMWPDVYLAGERQCVEMVHIFATKLVIRMCLASSCNQLDALLLPGRGGNCSSKAAGRAQCGALLGCGSKLWRHRSAHCWIVEYSTTTPIRICGKIRILRMKQLTLN